MQKQNNEKQKNKKYVFFTCLHIGKIFIIQEGKCEETITIQRDFMDKISSLNIDTNGSTFYFCTGPGSYTGIRQTLSFALGLKLGFSIHNNSSHNNTTQTDQLNIKTFNLFDYLSFVTNKQHIFINGFYKNSNMNSASGNEPGNKNIMSESLKGFAKINSRFLYITDSRELIEQPNKYGIKGAKNLIIVANPYKYITCENVINFVNHFNNFSEELSPLYINPVNITSPKHA